jgi:CheY-like chemotaxis protein
MMTQVRQFHFQQGPELLESLADFSQGLKTGYWRFQFDYFARQNQVIYWYLGIVDGRLCCSYSSPWSTNNLSKTLYRYVSQSQQPKIKAYLSELHQSGQIATLSPKAVLSEILVNGWAHKWQLEAALRMKILVDMDTYLTLGAGQAEFIQDDNLANDLPLRSYPIEELGKISLERQANWQQFKRFLPSMNLVPVLNPEKFLQANLNASQRAWIEQQVRHKLPLSRIASRLGQDPLEVAKAFLKLVSADIIQLVPPEQLATPTIMVIDDSPLVLRQFQQWIGAFGYPVILCQHAEQAINTIKQTKPSLIFLDINMPQISGFDLVKQIRMMPDIAKMQVVILTAEQKLSNKWRAQWSNCEFLTKPLSTEEMHTFPSQLQLLIQNLLLDTAPPSSIQAKAG